MNKYPGCAMGIIWGIILLVFACVFLGVIGTAMYAIVQAFLPV